MLMSDLLPFLVQGGGGQPSFTLPRLNLNLKMLGEILVSNTGGSINLHHVQAKFELKNFRLYFGQQYWGVNIDIDHVLSPSYLSCLCIK